MRDASDRGPQNSDQVTDMATPVMRSLGEILANASEVKVREIVGEISVKVAEITHDSSQVVDNSIFCCVVGEQQDGHNFAEAAKKLGAVALLVQRRLDIDLTQIVVDDVRSSMGFIAAEIFGRPSKRLNVVGVTGTNGKTTTAHFLASILNQHGWSTTVFGTLSGTRTTPESTDLQRSFAAEASGGRQAVVMEVSSHAMTLRRVEGTNFCVTIFTNLGQDHLDFHKTTEEYFAAKARLFSGQFTGVCVVNRDDVHGSLLIDSLAAESGIVCATFGAVDATQVETSVGKLGFKWRGEKIQVSCGGQFNLMNALAAATAAAELGVAPRDIAKGLAAASAVPGRFESIDAGQKFGVIVDYAHTPEALQNVLTAARQLIAKDRRVVVVFGCGGERDHSKRPKMGSVATKFADVVYVTSDNPRREDAQEIIDQILSGVGESRTVQVEVDRRRAIAAAFSDAKPGDIVVIAGKGHEATQTIGDEELKFSDADVSRELLRFAS